MTRNWQDTFQTGETFTPTVASQLAGMETDLAAATAAATTITVAAGTPSGAPANGSPIYLNSSAAFDLYVWTGSAWKGPYKVT